MAQNVNPTFVKTPNVGAVQITTGTGSSAFVSVYTGAANGSKIAGFIATAVNTTAAFDVQWGILNATSSFFMLATSSVPQSAGSASSVAAINLLNNANLPSLTLDSDGNPFIFLRSSADSLQAKTPATSSQWAAGAIINLIVSAAGDF